jgi:8-oxo-dGTP pyrophosphatase MutT (NUDIX family)
MKGSMPVYCGSRNYRPSPIEEFHLASALLQRLHDVLAQDTFVQSSFAQGSLVQEQEQIPCPPLVERRQAAVLLALTDEEAPRLLMIRRALHLPTHPGEIAFPGGKRDEEDSDIFTTAVREAWEEVALPSESVRYAGMLEPRASLTDLQVTAIVGVIPPNLPLRAHVGEVAEILFVPLSFFADPKNLRADRTFWNGEERITARFQYEHYTIWGLSARFIVDLTNRLYNASLDVELRAQRALS